MNDMVDVVNKTPRELVEARNARIDIKHINVDEEKKEGMYK